MPPDPDVTRQRRQALTELIRQGAAGTQAELVAGLRSRGFTATQSAISRDLKHLGVAKVGGCYVLPATFLTPPAQGANGAFEASDLARWVKSAHAAGPYLLVVRTAVGAASQVAATLDGLGWGEIVGTVAGDDTIFLATESKNAQAKVARRLFESEPRTGG